MFELRLSSKRKLGFVKGTITRKTIDETLAMQLDTCNDLVISWIHGNGSRKYKLNKELFRISQGKMKISEYYTVVNSLWEEIDSVNGIPMINTVVV